ncbi:MAG: hypothetical protein ACXABY_17140 [Candidatus Thorarchaeota archaeon]|jgi:hypothetical protein
MKRLKHWESGRDEMRKIPIVCPACETKVQVNAFIEDGNLVIGDCPACEEPISGALYVGEPDDDVEEQMEWAITAEIKWNVEGSVIQERRTKIGPVPDIPSILIYVLRDSVDFFGGPGISGQELYEILATFIVGNELNHDQVKGILALCGERLAKEPADVELFSVIKSNGKNGDVRKCDGEDEEEDAHDE